MPKLKSVAVEGLFGFVDHTIVVNPNLPTVITGPNGTGKTHVFRLIDAAIRTDSDYLLKAPFGAITLTFEDRELSIRRSTRDREDGPWAQLQFLLATAGGGNHDVKTSTKEAGEPERRERELPPWIIQLASGRYYDSRLERLVSRAYLETRYHVSSLSGPLTRTKAGRELIEAMKDCKSVLIDTKRLDSEIDAGPRSSVDRPREAVERINAYVREIQGEIATARESSLHRSQATDLRFAERALEAATLTVRLDDLKSQYREVIDLYEEMARNGLAPDETPAGLPENPNKTAKRILALLLQDWKDRLLPLTRVNRKLNELRSVLDSKLEVSGKRTYVGPKGRLGIVSLAGRQIPVERLSSGEQHMLAIFSQLLFATRAGSIVLIDEPEISMHLSWQHSFLDDVRTIAETSDLQVLLATHSAGIINGQWDLVQELRLPEEGNTSRGEQWRDELVDAGDDGNDE